jgi:biopolymer transport protein ExbD
MPRLRRRPPLAEVEANLTPLIDVSFLLIVFFALVSGINGREQATMDLARLAPGAAAKPGDEARWVLNVLPTKDGGCAGYGLNGAVLEATPDGVARLAEALAEGYRANPRLAVNLRADRTTRYEFVEPAMRATTTAARLAGGGAMPRLHLVVEELAPETAAVEGAANGR